MRVGQHQDGTPAETVGIDSLDEVEVGHHHVGASGADGRGDRVTAIHLRHDTDVLLGGEDERQRAQNQGAVQGEQGTDHDEPSRTAMAITQRQHSNTQPVAPHGDGGGSGGVPDPPRNCHSQPLRRARDTASNRLRAPVLRRITDR